MKKKVVSLLLVTTMVASLAAGCGDSSSSGDGTEKTGKKVETVDDGHTLTAWAWDANFNIPALKAAAEDYKKNVDPILLRQTLRSAAVQATKKFVYSKVGPGYKTAEVQKAVELLTLAGILHPVTHTDANGLPLGSERDESYQKMLLLDPGLLLRLLNMSLGDISELTTQILTASAADLVNKGPMAELVVGLEMLHHMSPNIRHDLYYWVRHAKNSQAEVDYISSYLQVVVPVEVKADKQGGMKSLWSFMRDRKLHYAIRCSMENFGKFDYVDNEANGEVRHVRICPMYAVAKIEELKQGIEK